MFLGLYAQKHKYLGKISLKSVTYLNLLILFFIMGIFKQNYGALYGELQRKEWKRLLNSNKGLFKRVKSAPPSVIGPSLAESGKVVGDMMFMETAFFMRVAGKDQREFYDELERVNQTAAKEYVLTISGSIERWKEDVKWLTVALHYLKKEEDILKKEERLAEEETKLQALIKLPAILKRHFPHLFKDINLENLNLDDILNKIKSIENKVSSEEHYLNKYIKKLRHEMPFLFE